ncbi:MAG TPA: lipid-binding SYLF domain-containing protein [Pirellulales bacterium]|nr:lipid-binding SYLF domain-containing protein [Pirellulales bacterium]
MPRIHLIAALLASCACTKPAFAAREPAESVRLADQVLHEIMSIPARRIPEQLLADAQGLVIIPGVIKIGFVGGIRRGRGVVLVRDSEGAWSIPQFVTLTGGSVGWQVGVQATDVVLVFRTKQSVENLLGGKFTLGADASVAAGPVGRSAEAATDTHLEAEILSYSRSRGVFAGVAIDGTAIEIDEAAHQVFYGTPTTEPPFQVPESAMKLLQDVETLTAADDGATLAPPTPPADGAASTLDALRRALARESRELDALLNQNWRRYLVLPKEVFSEAATPKVEAVLAALEKFDRAAKDPKYRALTERREFQATHERLREYAEALDAGLQSPTLDLPPPPDERGDEQATGSPQGPLRGLGDPSPDSAVPRPRDD